MRRLRGFFLSLHRSIHYICPFLSYFCLSLLYCYRAYAAVPYFHLISIFRFWYLHAAPGHTTAKPGILLYVTIYESLYCITYHTISRADISFDHLYPAIFGSLSLTIYLHFPYMPLASASDHCFPFVLSFVCASSPLHYWIHTLSPRVYRCHSHFSLLRFYIFFISLNIFLSLLLRYC